MTDNFNIDNSEMRDKGFRFRKCDGGICLEKYYGIAREIVVPSEYNGYSVVSIESGTFFKCSGIHSISIPDSIRSIGGMAFPWQETVSYNVSSDNQHFCSIDGVLFSKDKNVLVAYPAGKHDKEYVIPDGVTVIAESAFYHCINLTSISIPDGVASICDTAFSVCHNLISLNIPDSVTTIGESAFDECDNLISVTIGSGVSNIGIFAFADCSRLQHIHVSPDNKCFKSIDGVLFSKDMKTIIAFPAGRGGDYEIPYGVTTIEPYAFVDCDNLTSVTLPDTVSSISEGAFWGSERLLP